MDRNHGAYSALDVDAKANRMSRTENMDYTVLDAINDIDMDDALNMLLSSANG